MKKPSQLILLAFALITNKSDAAILVHAAYDIDCWNGDFVTFFNGLDSETFGSSCALSPANGYAIQIVEDALYVGGVQTYTQPVQYIATGAVGGTLLFYTIYDFWPTPIPTLGWTSTPIVLHYPLTVQNATWTTSPVEINTDGQSEVWLDWDDSGELRVIFGSTEPTDFGRYLSDGSEDSNWVTQSLAQLPDVKSKGKKLGHAK